MSSYASSGGSASSLDQMLDLENLVNCLSHIYDDEFAGMEATKPVLGAEAEQSQQPAHAGPAAYTPVEVPRTVALPEMVPVVQHHTVPVHVPQALGTAQPAAPTGFRWGDTAIAQEVESSDGVTDSPPISPTPLPRGAPAVEPTKFRTKVCRSWASGAPCHFGERCAFAHGEHQIRKKHERNTFHEVYHTQQGASQQAAKRAPAPQLQQAPKQHPMLPAAALGVPIRQAAGRVAQQQQQQQQQQQLPSQHIAKKHNTVNPRFVDTTGCVWFH